MKVSPLEEIVLVVVVLAQWLIFLIGFFIYAVRTLREGRIIVSITVMAFIVVITVTIFTLLYALTDSCMLPASASKFERSYLTTYFSIITLTNVGYGDVLPVGIGVALASLEAIAGYLLLGLLVAWIMLGVDRQRFSARETAERE